MRTNTSELWGFLTNFDLSWVLNYEKILIFSLEIKNYKKCDEESYTDMHLCIFTIFRLLSLVQHWSWGLPPWQTKWENIWSVLTTSWINVWCKQAVWTHVWTWITSVSLFGKKNFVFLFENYHKVVVWIYFKVYILLNRR